MTSSRSFKEFEDASRRQRLPTTSEMPPNAGFPPSYPGFHWFSPWFYPPLNGANPELRGLSNAVNHYPFPMSWLPPASFNPNSYSNFNSHMPNGFSPNPMDPSSRLSKRSNFAGIQMNSGENTSSSSSSTGTRSTQSNDSQRQNTSGDNPDRNDATGDTESGNSSGSGCGSGSGTPSSELESTAVSQDRAPQKGKNVSSLSSSSSSTTSKPKASNHFNSKASKVFDLSIPSASLNGFKSNNMQPDTSPWNPTHATILHAAVAAYGTNAKFDPVTREIDIEDIRWEAVALHFPRRTAESCYRHWRETNPGVALVHTPNGVMYVPKLPKSTMMQFGRRRNSRYENGFVGMNGLCEIHERSRPKRRKIKKKPWTEEEEKKIDELQQKLGNKWTKIAEELGSGRTGNDVKNYWHSKKDKIVEQRLTASMNSNTQTPKD